MSVKVDAIKRYRFLTGASLKEAADWANQFGVDGTFDVKAAFKILRDLAHIDPTALGPLTTWRRKPGTVWGTLIPHAGFVQCTQGVFEVAAGDVFCRLGDKTWVVEGDVFLELYEPAIV